MPLEFAELIGFEGIFVDDPEHLGAAWERALAATGPCVLEVKTDPEVPPLPPHITFKQAKSFMTAAVQGDPNEGGMAKGTIKQVLNSVFAGD